MDHDIEKRVIVVVDQRCLRASISSLFTAFSISFTILILFTTLVLMSNFSMEPQRDFSKVKLDTKRVIPDLPVNKNQIKQGRQRPEKLQVIENMSGGDNLSEKFQKRVKDFVGEGCEVNFVMTWISSSAESFSKREGLAIESVFKSHPNGCLMILSAAMDSPQGYTKLKPFVDLGYKVVAVTPDLPFLLKGTAGESWLEEIKTGKRDPGKISLAQNLSDLMRLAYLYKYGGVYLDTDMIVLKSFQGLRNVIGAQTLDPSSTNWTRLNNAVLIFDKNHPLLLKFIEEFAMTFNGNIWGYNGPYLVSRVARTVEGTSGYNFSVLRPPVFYPVNWMQIKKLFKKPKTEKDSKWVNGMLVHMKRSAYGLHLWNKFSRKYEMEKGSPIWKLVSEHCIICDLGSAS